MPIIVPCGCGSKLHVRDEAAGRMVECPKCGTMLPVPKPDVQILDEGRVACRFCAEMIQPAAIVCPFCKSRLRGEEPRPRVARDLGMEAHLRAIALWYRVGAILGFVGIALAMMFGMAEMGRRRGGEEAGVIVVVLMFVGGIYALIYLLGHNLAKYGNGARVTAAVLTIIGMCIMGIQMLVAMGQSSRFAHRGPPVAVILVVILIGVGWGIAIAWALLNSRSARICTEEYRQIVAQTPNQEPPTYGSPFFWLPLVLLGLFLLLAMAGGMSRGFR